MGLQSFLELCAKKAIRPTFANRSIFPPKRADTHKGGQGGANRIFVPLWRVHSLPELRAVRAILSGYFRGRKNTTWNFMRLAQYDRPPGASLPNGRSENRRSRWSLVFRAKLRGALFATPPNSRGSAKARVARRQGAPPPLGGFRNCIRGVSLVKSTSKCL